MEVEYGQIKDYKPKQGYGYVTRTFNNRILKGKKDVYFHIKTIKYNFPELAKQLDNGLNTNVHFWYVLDTNERGAEAIRIWLDADNIPDQYRRGLIIFLKRIWACRRFLPSQLEQITIDLADEYGRKELKESYMNAPYLLLEMIQEMDMKTSEYELRQRIKDVFNGLPDELIDELFWVEMEYQTNPRSYVPGGNQLVIEYLDGEVKGYDRIKDYIAYIEKILRKHANLSKYEFRKLNMEAQMEIAEDFIDRIFVRESRTEIDSPCNSFVEIWNFDTSIYPPTYAFKRYREKNLEAISV